MTKKLSPLKVASAAFAGLLVLGSGMAVAGACLSDDSTPEHAEVVSGQTDLSLIAQPGSEVKDNDADEIEEVEGDDDADDDDTAEVKVDAPHPANHGAQVSEAAHSDETVRAEGSPNHGATVSAVAKDNAGKDKGDDHDAASPPAPGSTPSVSDGDDDQDEVEIDDDADEDEDDAGKADNDHADDDHDADDHDDDDHDADED